ncbi:MAG: hypothetical protein CMP45_04095 [Rickettsiales bacterium]|nr:hypothetical protein [Rickettsiales bacterium]
MKTLTVVRHAKSSWNTDDNDHDRPLNKRGLNAASKVGAEIMRRGLIPDRIISSTAVRAATTAKFIANEISYDLSIIEYISELYLADISDYEKVISNTEEISGIENLMVVSHNPGSHELCHYLVNDCDIEDFITCAVASINLEIEFWGEINQGVGKLADFFTPHDL